MTIFIDRIFFFFFFPRFFASAQLGKVACVEQASKRVSLQWSNHICQLISVIFSRILELTILQKV